MGLVHSWQFLWRYMRNPRVVGAVAPSSRALASALCEPYRSASADRPARVLEVGAGTGAITRHLGTLLGPRDELDICEIEQEFADILQRDVLSSRAFNPAVAKGRVRLLRLPVQQLAHEDRYDFVIACLPFTNFELDDVREVFTVLRRCLKSSGVLSYFEYVGLRRTSRVLSLGRRRERVRSVSAYMARHIRAHQFKRQTVLKNFPPAHARHLRFSDGKSVTL